MADWLPRHSQSKDKDVEITGMKLIINVIEPCTDIPMWVMADKIRHVTQMIII